VVPESVSKDGWSESRANVHASLMAQCYHLLAIFEQ